MTKIRSAVETVMQRISRLQSEIETESGILKSLHAEGLEIAEQAKPRKRCEWSGKVRWSSKRLAIRATRDVSNRLRAYLCDECHRWHVTDGEKG